MPSYLSSIFRLRQPASYILDFVTHDVLVMLGMRGDGENDAGDVDGPV